MPVQRLTSCSSLILQLQKHRLDIGQLQLAVAVLFRGVERLLDMEGTIGDCGRPLRLEKGLPTEAALLVRKKEQR